MHSDQEALRTGRYERPKSDSRPGTDQVVPLLGHVLAHEIVHILSGTDSHSEKGVMKRRWNQSDLEQMLIRPLTFSNLDIVLLNFGIRDRHARLATIGNQTTVSTASLEGE
jgi:hypothetical protein